MNTKETSSLPPVVIRNENNQENNTGKGKTKKAKAIPLTIDSCIHDFMLPLPTARD